MRLVVPSWVGFERHRPPRRSRAALAATAAVAALFIGGSWLAPVLERAGGAGPLLRWAYAPLCHQRVERSLSVGGATQAVCSRCAGLHLGGLTGLMLGASVVIAGRGRAKLLLLVLAFLPSLIDVALASLLGGGVGNLPRCVMAWPAGLVAGLLLAEAIAEITWS